MSRMQFVAVHRRLGPDIAGGSQDHLGQQRTNQLVDQYGEEDDVADHRTLGTEFLALAEAPKILPAERVRM